MLKPASRNPERSRRAIFTPWFAYILLCKDNSLYTGITTNLKKRVYRHNQGVACRFTSIRKPVKLVYSEKFPNKSEARKREIQLKGWTRKKKQLLIEGKLF
jgi:putative endonuclease